MAGRDEIFYWIKLDEDFILGSTFDFLLKKYGSDYITIYLKLCGLSIRNNGILATQIGNIFVPHDIDTIKQECKWFDKEIISNAIDIYKSIGLLYENERGALVISNFNDIVGSETYWAKKKRAIRGSRKSNLFENINLADINNTEESDIGYVYLVKLDKHYKIGISINPEERLKEFTLLPYPLEEVCIERVKGYKNIEQELHRIFENKNVRGEWFELNQEDIAFIKNYLFQHKV